MTGAIQGRLCDRDQSLLAVIDIQTRLTAAMPPKVLVRLQRNTTLLLRAASVLRIPVFVTEQYPDGLGRLETDIEQLLPPDARRYEKTAFSCAGAGTFISDLRHSARTQVVLVGMETHVCILQSALDLMQLGYQVFVVAEAVCSRHRETYETALQRMRQSGAVVTSTESVMFEWLRDARHEQFRVLQPLLR
jgi:nicotinamidase-related amidase